MHPLAMFDRIAIINLVDRADRRRDMTRQIERVGGFDGGRIRFHPATRPTERDGFPSIGARGCFTSHLAILRTFLADGGETLLTIEDDFDFAPDFPTAGRARLQRLQEQPWDMFYGAYEVIRGEVDDSRPVGDAELLTTAFVAFRRATAARLVAYLEELLAGRPPARIHVDGAFNEFRWAYPDVRTFLAAPRLGGQRSSASSVTPGLLDRVPALRGAVGMARKVRMRLGKS